LATLLRVLSVIVKDLDVIFLSCKV
jgi:hypothetical protein